MNWPFERVNGIFDDVDNPGMRAPFRGIPISSPQRKFRTADLRAEDDQTFTSYVYGSVSLIHNMLTSKVSACPTSNSAAGH